MHSFEDTVIQSTISKLLNGQDYREEIIKSINVAFFDFSFSFFKQVLNAKLASKALDLKWYEDTFINDPTLSTENILHHSGLNKKTVSNIYGTANKSLSINLALDNLTYLQSVLTNIDDGDLNIKITLEYENISVNLNLVESLIVINALATKKLAIRGGAWSSIGKKVEKPLIDNLCDLVMVPLENRDNAIFKKNKSLDFDREIDYKLYSTKGEEYKVEVKLMGKGNPESADVLIARGSSILVADTLSEQNKKQLDSLNILYLQLKDNKNIINDFIIILDKLNIPYLRQNGE